MNATMNATILSKNETAAAIWDSGASQYDRISRQIADAIEHCVDRLYPTSGERILDLATGTGWTARRVAERGSRVCGVDLSSEAIEVARRLDPAETIEWMQGDAEQLTFTDASFDAVISTFGIMFCSDQRAAAGELARVCRPGGRISLAVWADHGGVHDLFTIISKYKPKPATGTPSPFAWCDPDRIHELLGNSFDLAVEQGVSLHRERAGEDAWEAFRDGYGPIRSLLPTLSKVRAAEFREEFIEYHEQHRTDVGVLVERPYSIITGIRNHD